MNPYSKTILDECSGTEVPNQRYQDFQAGIKEVVEWIEGKDHPVNISHIHIVKIDWQSKLKEWGIAN